MNVRILVFAQLAERAGWRERMVECLESETPRELVRRLWPALDLSAVRVAVDEEYRSWDEPMGPAKEVALIPPVSGG